VNQRKKNILVSSIVLSAAIFVSSLYLPDTVHVEFLYPMIVLLTISLPDNRSTFDASVGLTLLIVVGFFLSDLHHTTKDLIVPYALPILFIWSFTFAIFKYKESQIKLLRSTEHLNAMFKYANEGIVITNEKGDIIMANPTVSTQLGYSEEELKSMKVEALVPERFREHHPKHRKGYYEKPVNRPMGKGIHLSVCRKDGSEMPVEISLSPFRIGNENFVISFIIDITDRIRQEQLIRKANEELEFRVISRTMELAAVNKNLEHANTSLKAEMQERSKIEEALRDSERLYSTISHNFPDGIICVLNKELEIVFVDGQELDSLGIKSAGLFGRNWRSMDICSNSKADDMDLTLQKVFQWESCNAECTFRDRIYSMSAVPLPDNKGNVREILMVIRNITRRKKAEMEILQALDKEKELNEMKSRFVSIASHEFRTPLSTILSSVSLIDRYNATSDREKQLKHIDRIKSSVKNLTEILNDFLSLEKLEAGKVEVHPETIDLTQLCEELTEELQTVAGKGQKIIYRHQGEMKAVRSDKQLLRNIFINLLNNAIKYSGEDGIIEFNSFVDGEIRFEVKDHGIGIPKEDQPKLFERFFRATNASNIQGTGLGLNIVRRYTELLDGKIGFTSEVGQGTTFTVRLPKKD
jgi:PAS domain S-box-containing protein